ncbi:hypothetical protein HX045_10480 [Myroides odoratimimus]|uniref:Uncharacterized protein n=3 Tax=Myroides odoratimimus TaxID=76832 RepID=A0A0S7EHZ8_9FLAO|nr:MULTISPECIES: hypothetical protein [Myroides]AJA68136.1 hypothetical protein MYRA21_0961 [Myroides sp. A21]ALU25445.1 hypothetical protein AS202_04440 [Myroides odoratimimus]APA91461.1 hypothetical protein BK054_04325 [Myroides sp. ZB35]EHO05176.1 hypothetical protein HMPREF9714_03539 [Myroides odoratimimus CCUG 12901]EHO05971.1 hypothetical protein HMPREF9715_03245 [Myroides odoratimimus CIP 101113]
MQDKITLLEKYFETGLYEDFHSLQSDLVIWVDWSEYDDAIVEYIETCLQTGHLSASIEDLPNEQLQLKVNYDNKIHTHIIVDRDNTIIWLNSILQPEYEIRFCKISDGSDTLAFLPLTREHWRQLETIYTLEKIEEHFEAIHSDSVFFNKEYDFDEDSFLS